MRLLSHSDLFVQSSELPLKKYCNYLNVYSILLDFLVVLHIYDIKIGIICKYLFLVLTKCEFGNDIFVHCLFPVGDYQL